MESGRQRLSQRRKEAALPQGLRSDRLAAQRPTGARWETGDTEPPPSSRSHVASTPQVPLAELARLSIESMTDVPEPAQTERPNRPSSSVVPARSWWLPRLPAAGVLAAAFAGGTASLLLFPPHSAPVPAEVAVTPALTTPVAVSPASDPDSGTGSPAKDTIRVHHPAPARERAKPVDGVTPSPTDTAPKASGIQSDHRVTIQRKPAVTPSPGARPTPAEAYEAWSRAAGFDANDQQWPRLRPEPPPHR